MEQHLSVKEAATSPRWQRLLSKQLLRQHQRSRSSDSDFDIE